MLKNKPLENFPSNTIKFLKQLEKNNSREWFEKNREKYEENFLKPAQEFVVNLGAQLQNINHEIQAIPKIDKSIFRIHRDVRFSKNKDPYKTNLGLLFWEGHGKKMESSGLYFHVDTKKYFIATGMYTFTKDQLKKYRKVIADDTKAYELSKITDKLTKKGYALGGKTYKKVPRGIEKDYKFAELTLFSGVYAYKEDKIKEIAEVDLLKFCVKTFRDLKPLHSWLVSNIY